MAGVTEQMPIWRGFVAALVVAYFWPAASALAQACQPMPAETARHHYVVAGGLGPIPYQRDRALDAYVHRDGRQRPTAVVIHGGGWTSGSRIAHVGQLLELLTRAGYNWFTLDYTLAGRENLEPALGDIRAGLAFIRCHATTFGIDAARLVLVGEDSGAHLAAALAAERPAGVIGAVLIGGFYENAPRAAKSPPLLIVHGSADTESPPQQAEEFCRSVRGVEGRCDYVPVNGASHRSENWWPSQWGYKQDVLKWLGELAPAPKLLPSSRTGAHLAKDVVYSRSPELKLDAFTPPSSTPLPAVIVVHGGGWEAGDKVTYVTPLFEPLARAGLAWFSIDYRLTPAVTHEQQLQDVRKAIQFVRTSHARFNIDPRKIVLIGESASGQMVAQLATEDPTLAGVISFYGVYDFPAMVTDASPRSLLGRLFRRNVMDDEALALLRRYSPLYHAHKNMPPLLMINGTGERLWAQAQAFAQRLRELGARHELIALEGAPHGLENWEGHPEWTAYKSRMIEWIREAVR